MEEGFDQSYGDGGPTSANAALGVMAGYGVDANANANLFNQYVQNNNQYGLASYGNLPDLPQNDVNLAVMPHIEDSDVDSEDTEMPVIAAAAAVANKSLPEPVLPVDENVNQKLDTKGNPQYLSDDYSEESDSVSYTH